MLLRLALVSLVLAAWLVMPHTAEEAQPKQGALAKPQDAKLVLSSSTIAPLPWSGKERLSRKERKRKRKRRRKEKRRKGKKRRQGKRRRNKEMKKRKEKKGGPRAAGRRHNRKKNKKKKKKRKKKRKMEKMAKAGKRGEKHKRGGARKERKRRQRNKMRKGRKFAGRPHRKGRGRRRRARTPCATDDDCKSNHCCLSNVCIRPGRGLKCFGPCMCKARKKTKNFICVTKRKKMFAHLQRYGNMTEKVPRGHCRNITQTELRSSKFVEIKPLKKSKPLN